MNIYSIAFFRHPASAYESERAGEARGKFFINYLQILFRAFQFNWSGWVLALHYDYSVSEFPYFRKVAENTKRSGYPIILSCEGDAETLCGSMLWRMKALFYNSAEYVVCRDLDSLPTKRDFLMTQKFIESGKTAHIVHDSVSHSGMMGGTLGLHAPRFRETMNMNSWNEFMKLASGFDMNVHGADQSMLNTHVYPKVRDSLYLHELNQDTGMNAAIIDRTAPSPQDELDRCCNGVGLAFHVEPAMAAYRRLVPDDPFRRFEI